MRKLSMLALAAVLVVSLAGCKNEGGVAVVDAARLYQESASGKAGIEHLQKLEAALQARLMNAQEQMEKSPKDEALRGQFQAEFAGFQQLVQGEQQKVVEGIQKQMMDALEKARKKGDYAAVLASESVLASAPKADITDAVLKAMDAAPLTFADVELPGADGEKAAPAEKPAAETPADAEKSTATEAPAEAEKPAMTETPAAAEMPAEAEKEAPAEKK